jgi:hypothetical protein
MKVSLLAATAILAALVGPAGAQDGAATLGSALATLQPTMKLKQFDATWFRASLKPTEGGQGDMMSKLLQIGMMAEGGKMKSEGLGAALGLSMLGGLGGGQAQVCFTQGRTVVVGPETFLVAYTVESKGPNVLEMLMQAAQGGKEPDMAALFGGSKWTEDTLATLSLVNVRTVGALMGLRPFDLATVLAEGGSGMPDLAQLFMLGATRTEMAAPEMVPAKTTSKAKAGTKPGAKP